MLDSEIWYGVVSGGASTSITFSLVGGSGSGNEVVDVAEYSGVSTSGLLDKTATASGSSTVLSTGTTDTTSQASELWIGCVGLFSPSSFAVSTPQSGFTLLDSTVSFVGEKCSNSYLENVVSSTGAASSGVTTSITTSSVGCIATFKALIYSITPSADSHSSISPNVAQTINYGGSQGFTYSANTGYHLTQVLVDGSPVSLVTYPSSYTFSNVQATHTIAVISAINTYTLTPSTDSFSSISPNTAQNVNYGGSQTFTYSANTGYSVTSVLVDGSSVSITGSYTFSSVSASHSIAVSSTLNTYTITASAGLGGSITPTTNVNYGANQAFIYTPNTGYHVTQVLVDGSGINLGTYPTSYTFTNVQATHTIAASFAINTYTLTPSNDSHSTISPSTAQTVNYGSNNAFSYSPSTGYHITQVLVDSSAISLSLYPTGYTFNSVVASHTISVSSAINTYTITSSNDAHSTITATATVNYGDSKTFTYSANSGYSISSVLVDGSAASITGSYTFSNVGAAHTISLTSTLNIYPTSNSASGTLANSSVTFSSGWNDGLYSLSGYIFSSNNSGTWTNSTWTAFTSTPQTVTTTKILNATIGQNIGYQWYANDSTNNWGTTGLQALTTTALFISASNDTHSSLSPNGLVAVCYNGSATFTFTANNGFTIQNVIINGSTQAALTSPYIFYDVQGNNSIAISTSNQIYYINVTSDSGCTMYPNGVLAVPFGTWANFTCSAYPGYQLYSLYINGSSAGPLGSFNFMPTGNTTLYLVSQQINTGNIGGGGGGSWVNPTPTPAQQAPEPTTEAGASSNNFVLVTGAIGISLTVFLVFVYGSTKKKPHKQGEWS